MSKRPDYERAERYAEDPDAVIGPGHPMYEAMMHAIDNNVAIMGHREPDGSVVIDEEYPLDPTPTSSLEVAQRDDEPMLWSPIRITRSTVLQIASMVLGLASITVAIVLIVRGIS